MTYLNIDEVESALINLSNVYPSICELITLPHLSIEGRTCHALRIGKGTVTNRDGILFTGGVHAREWGSSEICVYFAADILEAYTNGTGLTYGGKSFNANQVQSIIEGLNLFVFADVNPDGRHHSQMTEALWRRNRNPVESGGNPSCIGVDLNRNHDFLWDFPNLFSPAASVVTSTDPCDISQTYRGSTAASEPETQNIRWLLDEYTRIRWYVDIHCYGELILYNWGDDENQSSDPNMNFANPVFNSLRGLPGDTAYKEYILTEDLNNIVAIANRMHDAIQAVRGRDYSVGQAYGLYATSGAGDDYAYKRHLADLTKAKVYGFTIEWGTEFQPPWDEMERIISDISAGMLEFCSAAPCQGGSVQVDLTTPSINFNDIPEGETTVRAVVFSVRSCRAVQLQIVSGPTTLTGAANSFGTPLGTTVSLGTTTEITLRTARIWISYTATNNGDTATGEVTVRCTQTSQEWTIPITANTISRPKAAVVMVLDKSGSMDFDGGDGRKRIQILKDAAPVFAEVIQPDNALGIVSFDQDAYDVMPITPAGPEIIGGGRINAKAAISAHTPNPSGTTSIGDGVDLAHQQLQPISGYDVKAMIVLTDGQENTPKYIADVMSEINERVFAIGLGTAEQINPVALTALTNGTGGYLLLTGILDTDDYFRLSKYYLQILAGVTNTEIVLDPEGWLYPDQVHRIPLQLNEADINSDIILLTPNPREIHFHLETPNGDIIDPTTANPSVKYVVGDGVSYYRINLPVAVAGGAAHSGTWYAVLSRQDIVIPRLQSTAQKQGIRYSLNVHSYSNLRMRTTLSQNSYQPGAEITLRAVLSEYDLPVESRATVQALLERPDSTETTLSFAEVEPGVFETKTMAPLPGIYRLRTLANGRTLRGRPFTREQSLTAAVWKGGDEPLPTSKGDTSECCQRSLQLHKLQLWLLALLLFISVIISLLILSR